MPGNEKPRFLSSEYTLPVQHEITYLDQRFIDWLETTTSPRRVNQLLNYWFSTVCIAPTNQTAYAYPTGGRVLTFTLPQPYPMPDGKTSALKMDAKGVGLTGPGWN